MKYDRLYNFISPVTGRLPLKFGYTFIGDKDGYSFQSPVFIDITQDIIDLRRDLDKTYILKKGYLWIGNGADRREAALNINVNNLPILGAALFPYPDIIPLSPVPIPNPTFDPLSGFDWLMSGPWLPQIFAGNPNTLNTSSETVISSSLAMTQIKTAQAIKRLDVGSFIVKSRDISFLWENPLAASIPDEIKQLYGINEAYTFTNAQALDELGDGIVYNTGGVLRKAISGEDYVNTADFPIGNIVMLDPLYPLAGHKLITATSFSSRKNNVNEFGEPIAGIIDILIGYASKFTRFAVTSITPLGSLVKAGVDGELLAADPTNDILPIIVPLILPYTERAETAALEAESSATAAKGSETAAETSASAAETAAGTAEASAVEATTAAGEATTAATEATAAAAEATAVVEEVNVAAATATTAAAESTAAATEATTAAGESTAAATEATTAANESTISASEAAASATTAAETLQTFLNTNLQLTGDISGSGLVGSPITTTFIQNPSFYGNEYIKIPFGTTAQRPANPSQGMFRINTDTWVLEYYNTDTNTWISPAGGSGSGTVTSIGLTANSTHVANITSDTSNPITDSGTFNISFSTWLEQLVDPSIFSYNGIPYFNFNKIPNVGLPPAYYRMDLVGQGGLNITYNANTDGTKTGTIDITAPSTTINGAVLGTLNIGSPTTLNLNSTVQLSNLSQNMSFSTTGTSTNYYILNNYGNTTLASGTKSDLSFGLNAIGTAYSGYQIGYNFDVKFNFNGSSTAPNTDSISLTYWKPNYNIDTVFTHTTNNNTLAFNSNIAIPFGTTAQRPINVLQSTLRFNTDTQNLEVYNGTNWISSGTVTSVGINGSNGIVATNTPITNSGNINLSLNNVPINVLSGYPSNSNLFLNGNGGWTTPAGVTTLTGAVTGSISGNTINTKLNAVQDLTVIGSTAVNWVWLNLANQNFSFYHQLNNNTASFSEEAISGSGVSVGYQLTPAANNSTNPSIYSVKFRIGTTSYSPFNITSISAGVFTASLSASLNMNNNSITNVVDPVNNQDVATKHYVDTHSGSSSTKSILQASILTTYYSNLDVGDHFKFDNIIFSNGNNILLNTTSPYSNVNGTPSIGKIYLTSGSLYKLTAYVTNVYCSNQVARTQWYYTSAAVVTPLGLPNLHNVANNSVFSCPSLVAYLDLRDGLQIAGAAVELRILLPLNTVSNTTDGSTYFVIEEL